MSQENLGVLIQPVNRRSLSLTKARPCGGMRRGQRLGRQLPSGAEGSRDCSEERARRLVAPRRSRTRRRATAEGASECPGLQDRGKSWSGYKKKTHKCCTRAIFNCFRLLHALSQGVLKWWSPGRKRSGLRRRNRTFRRGGRGGQRRESERERNLARKCP